MVRVKEGGVGCVLGIDTRLFWESVSNERVVVNR